jgi:hypothetical protein
VRSLKVHREIKKRQLFACEQSYLISYTWRQGAQHDETLPVINKTKAPKRRERESTWNKTKWKDACPRQQKNHPRGRTTKGTSSQLSKLKGIKGRVEAPR